MTCGLGVSSGQVTQPIVAIHDSELTRALESMNASGSTPTGPGTTGKEWWTTDWHYFVMPESLKEAFRSDGTPFTVVGDSNITAGVLLTNGMPRYPIVFSLASEAIRDNEIAAFTNYVAAGGFLFIGGSAFSRNTNGTTRGDFAFANQMGLHAAGSSLSNWTNNNNITKQVDHRLTAHLPSGALTWRMPSAAEEIPWGISPSHPFIAPHDTWQVTASGATVLVQGDGNKPFLTIRPYGKGYFIYCSTFQPLIGFSGFAPSTYAYLIFRRAIEWAFETVSYPVAKLSPWPFQYDAAMMVRHDLENFTNSITNIEASAQIEASFGVKGEYYFCTGTLRDDAAPAGFNVNSIVASLRRAVTNYGATIGPHNGGLKNPNNAALVRGQYDYWHWGPDEALDVSPPPSGYASGKAYALASMSNSLKDIEGWLTGTTNGAGLRPWCTCYFNGTREDSYDLQAQLNVKITGDQKLTPFPHWTLSTLTPGKRYSHLSQPVSDWLINGLVAQSLEPWHSPGIFDSPSLHTAIDFFYNQGFLVNFYSHTMTTGLGDAGNLVFDYVSYCANTNLHPRMWLANAITVYQWWLQRSNAQISVSVVTNGPQTTATFTISGAANTNTAVELLTPGSNSVCSVQVLANGSPAPANSVRTNGQIIRVRVGTTVTNVVVTYFPYTPSALIFADSFDGVSAPGLPPGWTTAASSGQSNWVTQTSVRDTAPNAAFCPDLATSGTSDLISPPVVLPVGQAWLSFTHDYDLEPGTTNAYDGGVLEIKIGTNAFTDIITAGGSFVNGGYITNISPFFGNPLGGRMCWSGDSVGFVSTVVALPASTGGQTNQFRWRLATDNGNSRPGWRVDTVGISSRSCLCCTGTNTAPVLPGQGSRTVSELAPLVVVNTASDAETNALFYVLNNPPAGATISPNGIITWTPDETQGPGSYAITTIVTDNGYPPLSATNTFNVTVNEVNSAPSLPNQADRTINELAPLTVANAATDTDVPANTLSYSLTVAPPVTNAQISVAGTITWTPSEAYGPGVYTFTTIVSDGSLSDTNSFTVTVNEVNTAPFFLGAPANRTIAGLSPVVVTNTAGDSDLPANPLTYTLQTPPANSSIDANGVITWNPIAAQDPSTNIFTTVVTDTNAAATSNQRLSATNSFTVVLNSHPSLVFDSSSLAAEGCTPGNNAIDPGETVTVLFAFRNAGLVSTTNLTVSLLATNGVLAPSGPQTYGVVASGLTSTQSFTFTGNGSCGGSISPTFLLQDNAYNLGQVSASLTLGATGICVSQNFDGVVVPAIPAGWTNNSSSGSYFWATSTNQPDGTNTINAFAPDTNVVSDVNLISPVVTLPGGQSQLSFRHRYGFEVNASVPTNGYDGGVVEIKIGTNAFTDIIAAGGAFVTSNGYNSKIDANYHNPLTNRFAWSGTITNYTNVIINLPLSASGQNVQFRWRVGTDDGTGGIGWRIDSIAVSAAMCCANTAPVLGAQSDRTITELATLVVTNTATDSSTPPSGLSYALSVTPAATNAVIAVIDTNGIITWTPTETQGPGVYTLTTIVTDNASPPLSATNSFNVTVLEGNTAPVLPATTNYTINELATLTVTNTATDPDVPANNLSYALTVSPLATNAAISTNGVIVWTPTEAQGPGVYTFTTVVTDDGQGNLSATNSLTVTVLEANNAPVLPATTNYTINELATLTVTNTATDPDIPANNLGYALSVSPPATNAVISANGVVTWIPSEAQGPGVYTFATVVTDDGPGALSATNIFTVTVLEVNSAPVLPGTTNYTINELTTLTVTNAATDPDVPANNVSYALTVSPAATNAVISTNGVIIWTPSEAQGPGVYTFTTVVTDDGQGTLSATNTFTVTVLEVNIAPSLPAQAGRTIVALASLIVTNTATDSDLPANAITYGLSGPANAAIDSNGIITWNPVIEQVPSTNIFTTIATDLNPLDAINPQLSVTNSFTVVVQAIHNGPSLPPQNNRSIGSGTTLVVTNTASVSDIPAFTLHYSLLAAPANAAIDANGIITWTPGNGPLLAGSTNLFVTRVVDVCSDPRAATNSFAVMVTAPPPAPVIQSVTLDGDTAIVQWSSSPGHSYQLEYLESMSDTNWNLVLPPITATDTTTSMTNQLSGASHRFFRVILLP